MPPPIEKLVPLLLRDEVDTVRRSAQLKIDIADQYDFPVEPILTDAERLVLDAVCYYLRRALINARWPSATL